MRIASRHRLMVWPVHSQDTSRRNARIALAALQQHRLEQQEAEEFLKALRGQAPSRLDVERRGGAATSDGPEPSGGLADSPRH
jgi:GAF domain-containing protein